MRKRLFRFDVRLKMLWKVLTGRNVIMLYNIKEFEINGESARSLRVGVLTEYTRESDALSCAAAAMLLRGELVSNEDNGDA